jgi:phosphatidate phosphatase PAH1
VYDDEKSIETTIGQLNFFRWVIQNDILEFINENIEKIDNDMLKTQRENSLKKNHEDNVKVKEIKTNDGVIVQKRKKRIQLSKNSIKNMNLMNGQHTIKFD